VVGLPMHPLDGYLWPYLILEMVHEIQNVYCQISLKTAQVMF
jgi:hypothetical protein